MLPTRSEWELLCPTSLLAFSFVSVWDFHWFSTCVVISHCFYSCSFLTTYGMCCEHLFNQNTSNKIKQNKITKLEILLLSYQTYYAATQNLHKNILGRITYNTQCLKYPNINHLVNIYIQCSISIQMRFYIAIKISHTCYHISWSQKYYVNWKKQDSRDPFLYPYIRNVKKRQIYSNRK